MAQFSRDALIAAGVSRTEMHELPAIVSFPEHAECRVEAPTQIAIQANTLGHSVATMPEGITAELIYVGSGDFADYDGKDVRGKIILTELSYSPARHEKQRIAGLKGSIGAAMMNWGPPDNEAVPFGSVKPVWGNPTPQNYKDEMPTLPCIGIEPTIFAGKLVVRHLPGSCHPGHGARLQLVWRWPARPRRSQIEEVTMTPEMALSIRNLRISISTGEGTAKILDRVQLDLPRGKVVGIAGESGCGKSTLIRAILGILPRQARVESGEILFENTDLLKLSQREMQRRVRGRAIGFIPQDPFLALNPVFTVGTQLMEILRWHGLPDEEEAISWRVRRARHRQRLIDLLRAVQVPSPEDALDRYPHQFSGGQRQRLLIAGALACRPRVILADEPTTALDVTTQLQILKLLKELTEQFDVSMLFVTHDFGVIAQLCDSVSVMYAGQTVEAGSTPNIIDEPMHPYTRALMRCHPDRSDELKGISGQVPSPLAPPTGCRFRPRCPQADETCATIPPFVARSGLSHVVTCRLYDGSRAL